MIKSPHFLILLLFTVAFTFPSAVAQTTANNDDDNSTTARFPMWRAELPGGTYSVNLNTVDSVSSHQFIVIANGAPAARVTEVVVGANGPTVARFYYVEPLAAQSPVGIGQSGLDLIQSRVKQVTERTGTDVLLTEVVKDYPLATHAHTIEYRLASQEDIDKLFKHLDRAWKRKRSATFKLQE